MAKTKVKVQQSDSLYVLKLVLYLIIGSQWIFFVNEAGTSQVPVPVGFLIGLIFTSHEHFTIDRKIEYAVLLIAMFVGFWADAGFTITWLSNS